MNVDRDRQPDMDADEETWPEPLTRTEAVRMFGARALETPGLTPARLVGLQMLCGALGALLWWVFAGMPEAISALAGCAVVALPGGMFALRMHLAAIGGRMGALQIFTGQVIKLVMTLLLFCLFVFKWPDVRWLPLMLAVVLTVKVQWLALMRWGLSRAA